MVQRPFFSSTSTFAAISHILGTVASSIAMGSRLGRWSLIDIVSLNMLSSRMSHFFPHSLGKSWSLISLSASTPVRAAALRRSGLGSSVWRAHHEPLLLSLSCREVVPHVGLDRVLEHSSPLCIHPP